MIRFLLSLLLVLSLVGCAKTKHTTTVISLPPPSVPRDAKLLAGGRPPLSALVNHPGVIYLVDDTAMTLPHSADFSKLTDAQGMLFSIDLERAALTVRTDPDKKPDDATLLVGPLDTTHRFSLWFVPASEQPAAESAETSAEPAAQKK